MDELVFSEVIRSVLYATGALLSFGVVTSIILHYVRKNKKAQEKDYVIFEPIESEFVSGKFDLLFETFLDKQVRLSVTNYDGDELDVLVEDNFEEGIHRVPFDTTKYPNETYFLLLKTDNQNMNRRIKIKNIS